MTRIPLVAPHWLGAEETRWPYSLEVLENFGTVLCCKLIELSSGISSKPSVGVGLKENNHDNSDLSCWKYVISPHSGNVKTFCRSGRGQGVLGRGGRVGAGGHPHWTLQHIVKVSTSHPRTPGAVTSQHKYTGDEHNDCQNTNLTLVYAVICDKRTSDPASGNPT